MENSDTASGSESHSHQTEITVKTKHGLRAALIIIVLLIVAAAVYSVYAQQHQKVVNLNKNVSNEQGLVTTSKTQLASLTNTNSGTSTATPTPAATSMVSLDNGQVTFTMPTGWVNATASDYAQQCYIGGLAAQFCLDTTIIVPKALNVNNSLTTYGGITIAVFKHSDSTSAADWYNNDFRDAGENQSTGNQVSATTINGYDTYYVNTAKEALTYGDQFNNEYYAIVNKSYVVLITSNVNNNAGPNGTTKLNDNSQYSPIVKTFAGTVKMQGS